MILAGLTDDVDGRVAVAVTVVVAVNLGRVIHSLCVDGKVLKDPRGCTM